MRNTVPALCVVAGLTLAACEKAKTPEAVTPTPAPSTPAPATPAPATPAPEPPKSAEIEQPAPKQLAPDGVYFLRTAQRVETDAGIVGVKRGTQVRKIAENSYQTAEGEKLELALNQVTNDLEEVKAILVAERTSQTALQNWKQGAAQAEAAQNTQAATPQPSTPAANTMARRAATPPAARSTPASSLSSGGAGAQGGSLGTTHSNTREKTYVDSYGRRYWKDAQGRARYD